jgi:hypothetical protein
MEARYQRKLQSGENFNHFFPNASGENKTIRSNAEVSHTLQLIPKVVKETLHHTSQLAQHLKGNTLNQTCENIWDFVYQHIAYRKDEDGKEQVRSPARVWRDRKQGVDCDCYTTFISSILTNLHIPHVYRITKYFKPHYQHIYPIVPLPNGKHITIDCVVENFNHEEAYSQKQDTKMDLQYLNGIEDETILFAGADNVDVQDLIGFDTDFEMGDLGRRKAKAKSSYQPKGKSKVGNFLKKVAHVANKANPATVLLRNGVLASMKLNLFKTAQRLKWAYLSDEDAKKKGVDMSKFERLKKVRAKLESIFYGSGGKPENLKSAILKGKGNKGKEVNGFEGMDYMDENTPLSSLLGDVYENDFGELGEPATGAAIATATAVISTIAALLKGIGSIFPKKEEGSQDFENTEGGEQGANSATSMDVNKTVAPSITEDGTANPESNVTPNGESNSTAMMKTANPESKEAKTEEDDAKKEGMWEKNKKWMKPTLIGVGGVGLLVLGYKAFTSHKPPIPTARAKPMNGVRKRKKTTPKKSTSKKQTIHKQSLF